MNARLNNYLRAFDKWCDARQRWLQVQLLRPNASRRRRHHHWQCCMVRAMEQANRMAKQLSDEDWQRLLAAAKRTAQPIDEYTKTNPEP